MTVTFGHVASRRWHEIGDRLEDVLAVVEEQHELGVAEHRNDPVDQSDAGSAFDPQRGGDRVDG